MTTGEGCLGFIFIVLIIWVILYNNSIERDKKKYADSQRKLALEHLERILNDVRKVHRHILSEVITDEQINALKARSIKSLPRPHAYHQAIDNANTPDFQKAFRQALAKRIEAHRAPTLGNDANALPVKLTQHFRDRHVYIIGMEEELLPHRASIEEDNIEEERRLCYVGITRAMQTLALTHCTKRKQYGEMIDCTPSRFLDEFPYDDLVWEGEEKDEVLNQQRGQETLAGLKNLFD